MSFAKLDELCRSLDALAHAQAILGVDEATQMAPGGGEKRAEAMAYLAGLYHRQATDPQVDEWIAQSRNEALSPEQAIALDELERSYRNLTCLPGTFVERQTRERMRSEQVWREARANSDWKGFAPFLTGIVAMAREEAQMRSEALGLSLYDAMVEQYDPGLRTADFVPVFDALKSFLPEFVEETMAFQQACGSARHLNDPQRTYSIENQRSLGLAVMELFGFDLRHGSLSVSHHPFCGGVPTDVRITTRYRQNEFLSALMGTMHETGHALYEQNLPERWTHWPAGKARGMAMHESQSLFNEKQIGRNPAFWRYLAPRLETHFGFRWTADDVLPEVLRVEKGLIRVDADEVTYPLHIILRFELEQDLLTGRLEVESLPEAWDDKMQMYFGLSTRDNPADGPMQDVHWPGGIFGYFPSYTLGALFAAQQWNAVRIAIPGVDTLLENGELGPINQWRCKHIWSRGSLASSADILADATGEPLNADHFIEHLRGRYGREGLQST